MLKLPTVTLCAATSRDPLETLLALEHSQSLIEFKNTVYFSDSDPYVNHPEIVKNLKDFTYIKIPKFESYGAACVWFMTTFFKYKEHFGSHVLGVQWDGYPVQPNSWNDDFLKYDYIGAPWPNRTIGNNGFVLMSHKFIEGIEKLDRPPDVNLCHPCDKKLCIENRSKLEEFGIKFCPYELAFEFSTETYGYYDNPLGFRYNGSFGLHGPYSLSTTKGWDVVIPAHHQKWVNHKGNEEQLLSVPEFLSQGC